MAHRVLTVKLSRKTSARVSLLKNLASEAILHEKIVTTLPRAKAVRPFLEKLITKAKDDNIQSRRYLLSKLEAHRSVRKLLEIIGPAFKERKGGYTRITKLPPRSGDNASMAMLEFVENVSEIAAKRKIEEKPSKQTKVEKEPSKKISKEKTKEKNKKAKAPAKNKDKAKSALRKTK